MRRRILGFSAAVVLGALAPCAADAFEWDARAGFGYDRTDTWGPSDGAHGFVPKLTLDLGAGVRGYFVDPGIVDWDLGAGFNNQKTTYATSTDRNNFLSYNGTLGFLQGRGTKANLQVTAIRNQSQYSQDSNAARTTGVSTSEGYSVSGGTAFSGLPGVQAGFSSMHSTSSGFDRPETWEDRKILDLGMHHGQSNLESVLGYRMEWDSGSLYPVNFVGQAVNLTAKATPAEAYGAGVTAAYYLRAPSSFSPGNPRYESAYLDANFSWRQETSPRAWGFYRYRHDTIQDPGLPSREALSHTVQGFVGQRVTQEWEFQEDASASVGTQVLGPDRKDSSGQSLGFIANWTRGVHGISLGVRGGAIEPESGSASFAYGASASGRTSWIRTNRTINASYSVSYLSNLDATPGWALNQAIGADLTQVVGPFLTWSLKLQGSAARGDGGPFGSNANRSLQAVAGATYRRTGVDFTAGVSDSVVGALSNPVADGLFLPPSYDTHARFVQGDIYGTIVDGVVAYAEAKYTVFSGPLTQDQREALYRAMVRYGIGRWTFSVEDRYSLGGAVALDHRVNEIFVRAARTFGGRD
jgi:hypothetical protein